MYYNFFHIRMYFKLPVKSLLQSVSSLITSNTKPQMNQRPERLQQILANYVHISVRGLQQL